MGTETTLTARFIERLNALGRGAKFINKEAGRNRGHPDIIGCVRGQTYIIENKTVGYGKKRRGHALQLKELERWKDGGAKVFMPQTEKEREEIIKTVRRELARP